MVWTLHIYSEDFVLKPEIREHQDVDPSWTHTKWYAKAELWQELRRQYFGKAVLVHYVDGSRKWIMVPA